MIILCGLLSKFKHLMVAIDADADDEMLTLDFVNSRLLQEEQRMSDRGSSSKNIIDSALVERSENGRSGRPVSICPRCKKRGHFEPRCWQKYLHLKPVQKGLVSKTKVEEAKKESSDKENVVCLVADVSSSTRPTPTWVIDSNATSHICHDESHFTELSKIGPLSTIMGDDSDVHAKGEGVSWCEIHFSGSIQKCKLDAVLYVPGLKYNLISVVRMTKSGCKVIFEGTTCEISRNGKLIAEGSLHGMHYYLNTTSSPLDMSSAFIADFNFWHERLGHVHVDAIKHMVRNQVVRGMMVDSSKAVQKCVPCIYPKGK